MESKPDDDPSEYELTEEQRKAMLQMQQMQHERLEDDVWDPKNSIFGDMDYSTFVSQRLKEVNEQWDKEPLPETSNRQKLIEFKQDQELTSVYAPKPYPAEAEDRVDNFTTDESSEQIDQDDTSSERTERHKSADDNKLSHGDEQDEDSSHIVAADGDAGRTLPGSPLQNGHADKNKSKVKKKKKSIKFIENDNENEGSDNFQLSHADSRDIDSENTNNSASIDQEESHDHAEEGYTHSNTERNTQSYKSNKVEAKENSANDGSGSKEEKVLIELNGKFELVSPKDLQAMGYPLPDEMTPNRTNSSVNAQPSPSAYSHHARTSRPGSSVGPRSNESSAPTERRRAQSASTRPTSRMQDWDISHYTSPYALTKEQKDIKDRREKIIKEREQTEKERRKEEERRKNEEAESAFQWWLEKKEEERRERQSVNKQGVKEQDEKARKEENEAAFNDWCDLKREQQKKERLLKNREQRERDDAYFIRSRDECELAFKKWLKNKRKEHQTYNMSACKVRSKRKQSKNRSGKANNRSPTKAEWNGKMH